MQKHIFLLYLIFFLTGCQGIFDSSNFEIQDSRSLFPLAMGDEWTYVSDEYQGEIRYWIDSVFTYQYQDSLIEMFSVKFDIGWTGEYLIFYYNGSFNNTLFWNIEPENPEFCFKYPVNTGDQWINDYRFSELMQSYYCIDTYTCDSKSRIVVVPAGEFRCYDYKIERNVITPESLTYSLNYYFSPGIGLIAIKRTESDPDNSDQFIEIWERKLISYKIQ